MGYSGTDSVLPWIQKEDRVVIGQGSLFNTSYTSTHMILDHHETPFNYSLLFLSIFTVIQKVIQKYANITFNEGIHQKKKVLLHN